LPEIPAFEMYTEVLQDSVVDLLESGRCRFASTCSLTLSPPAMRRIVEQLNLFRSKILMRPQEISNTRRWCGAWHHLDEHGD